MQRLCKILSAASFAAAPASGMMPVKLRSRLETLRWKLLGCWMVVPSFGAALKSKPHLQGVSRHGCNICSLHWRICNSNHVTNHRIVLFKFQSSYEPPTSPNTYFHLPQRLRSNVVSNMQSVCPEESQGRHGVSGVVGACVQGIECIVLLLTCQTYLASTYRSNPCQVQGD